MRPGCGGQSGTRVGGLQPDAIMGGAAVNSAACATGGRPPPAFDACRPGGDTGRGGPAFSRLSPAAGRVISAVQRRHGIVTFEALDRFQGKPAGIVGVVGGPDLDEAVDDALLQP